jgi:hypothetical protein
VSADDTQLHVAWFPSAEPKGPALGDPESSTWSNFRGALRFRREGPKDGPGFCAARFRLEGDGRHVRRLKANLLARTAIALDIEANRKNGECPPAGRTCDAHPDNRMGGRTLDQPQPSPA